MQPELERVERQLVESAKVDHPIVTRMVQDMVKSGGKRLRPLLLLLTARAFGGNPDTAITAAAGVELLHTASLIHDDSIDRAALRRGTPTLNSEFSTGAVILIGDFLFAQSAILAAATGHPRVVMIFATSLAEICNGQLKETLEAHQLGQTRESYEERIYGKTAALFAGAAEMGAVIGGADDNAIQEMRAFGTDLGMAFQVVDDILDIRERTDTIGKPSGNDLRQGVVTMPVMLYAENHPEGSAARATIEGVISGEITDDATIDALVNDIRASGALQRAEDVAIDYIERARKRLEIVTDEDAKRFLNDMLNMAVVRQS
jgi:geranylgeranyl pyrophosphate synthase